MKIVFGWRRLTPPAFIGGAELTEASLARLCCEGGHEVTFVGSYENPRNPRESSRRWLEDSLRASGTRWEGDASALRYWYNGIRCITVSQRLVSSVVGRELAGTDVFFTSQEGCVDLAKTATVQHVFSYVHSTSAVGLASAAIPSATLLAPSRYVRRRLQEDFGRDAVLVRTPIVVQDRRADASSEPTAVLFVNPVREKGLAYAVQLAERMPNRSFTFVEAWRQTDSSRLPSNVALQARTLDMSVFYRAAGVLIVPSLVPDASPRVIPEASAYGVPSVGAPVGGIPEQIADHNLLLPTDDMDSWVAVLGDLMEDATKRRATGGRQFHHAQALYSETPADVRLRLGL